MSSRLVREQNQHYLPAAGHDLFLPFYDPLVRLLGGNRARQILIDQANLQPDQRILDIGCGTGTLVVQLKQEHEDLEVVGLDPDPKALERARKKARRARVSVQLDQGFSDELPYESGTFDRVFSSFMFHHLEEQSREGTFREVVRVLKPAGSFHLLDFAGGKSGSHGRLADFIHSSHRLKDNEQDAIVHMMRRAGFKHAQKTRDGRMLFDLLRTAYFYGGLSGKPG